MKIQLEHPIKSFGIEITEIEMREELKAGDLLAMDRSPGEVGKSFELIAELTGVPASDLKEMALSDYMKLSQAVEKVMGDAPFPATGGTSLET